MTMEQAESVSHSGECDEDVRELSKVLGHRSVNTTLVYLQEAERSKGIASLRVGLESAAQGSSDSKETNNK
jgi:hypothetical protein